MLGTGEGGRHADRGALIRALDSVLLEETAAHPDGCDLRARRLPPG